MELKSRLAEDLKSAMKSGDETKKNAIRLARGTIKNAEIEKGHELSEEEVVSVISKEIKMRKDSIDQFTQGGRLDLVAKQTEEMHILEAYLPEQMSTEEIEKVVTKAVAEMGVTGPTAIGAVMKKVMPEFKGKADGKVVNDVVRRALKL